MAVDLAAARMRIGEPDAQGVLMAMLQSPIPTPEARLRAALAVAEAGKLPRAPLRQALEAALRSGTVLKALRRDALVKLAVLQDPEALSQLQAAAQSGAAGGEQQTEALLVLALAHQKNAAENLRMATELASGSDLIELAVVLAQVGDKRAVGLLLPLLKDVQPKVRLRALGALCQLASAGLFPAYEKTLAPLLSDADPQIALTAAVALLGVGQPVPASTPTAAP
jgi:HEAT repeat protein